MDTYSVWIYGPEMGWWLHEEGYDSFDDAASSLGEQVRTHKQCTGGAIITSKKFPMPLCDECLRHGRLHHPSMKPVKGIS
jgi:hypothetical protein